MSEPAPKEDSLQLLKSAKIDIEFDNITFTVPYTRKAKKLILKGVSGKFKSGELTAIMGPSGAGKTSLLNILTGFQSSGMDGTIRSTGATEAGKGSSQYKKQSCYILQDDRLAPFFTVFETMKTAADLKLGTSISEKAKKIVIEEILQTLNLSACKDTRCDRLSGGQKKRLSIALELIDNPPIMFLDEPTTGLDSSSSAQCIAMLKKLAREGRTIVCTIHQPSATLYEMFDHVYMLADGKCVYQGASTNTVNYLSSIGLACPHFHNPADYMMEICSGEYGNLADHLSKTAVQSNWRKTTENFEVEENVKNGTSHKTLIVVQPPSEWSRFWILLNRCLVQIFRDRITTFVRIFLSVIVAVFIGLFYLNAGMDASKTIANFGYLIIVSVYFSYTSMMPAVLRYPSELPVLKKERFNNWYKLKTYYLALLIATLPLQIIICTAFGSITYFMSAQPHEWDRFLMFMLVCYLVHIAADSLGILLGTVANPVNGTFWGAIITAIMLVIAGFVILFSHMPRMMYYLSYLSYIRHALQALVQTVYGMDRAVIPCPEEVVYCHYRVPKILLKDIGMDSNSYWMNVGSIVTLILVFRIAAFYTLRLKLSAG